MENASKALIIAGAILLSIAIIGIGMTVYQMADGTVQNANLSEAEILTHNSKFTKYEGTQTGTTVRAMIDIIRTHNSNNQDDESKQIVLNNNATTATVTTASNVTDATAQVEANLSTIKALINAGTRYNIVFGYSTTGLIKSIDIMTPPTTTP